LQAFECRVVTSDFGPEIGGLKPRPRKNKRRFQPRKILERFLTAIVRTGPAKTNLRQNIL